MTKPKDSNSTPSFESLNSHPNNNFGTFVGDSLNKSLNNSVPLSANRSRPTNLKPVALPPTPPKSPKPKND